MKYIETRRTTTALALGSPSLHVDLDGNLEASGLRRFATWCTGWSSFLRLQLGDVSGLVGDDGVLAGMTDMLYVYFVNATDPNSTMS